MNDADFELVLLKLDANLLGKPIGRRLAHSIRCRWEALHLERRDAAHRARDQHELLAALACALAEERPARLK